MAKLAADRIGVAEQHPGERFVDGDFTRWPGLRQRPTLHRSACRRRRRSPVRRTQTSTWCRPQPRRDRSAAARSHPPSTRRESRSADPKTPAACTPGIVAIRCRRSSTSAEAASGGRPGPSASIGIRSTSRSYPRSCVRRLMTVRRSRPAPNIRMAQTISWPMSMIRFATGRAPAAAVR